MGFRVAKDRGLKKIYATDTHSWLRDEYKAFPILDKLWDEEFYLNTDVMGKWYTKYAAWYKYQEEIIAQYSVDECLKNYNNPDNMKRRTGHFLVELKTSNHNGPDTFALKWYDRNVRIFNNILKTNPTPEDRILVIYGINHIPLLEDLFDASPSVEIVRPYTY